MAPRPSWNGYLKLSLVSCPVALFPAINLMDALRRSVQAERGGRSTARRHSGKARSSARKRPARRAGMKRAG